MSEQVFTRTVCITYPQGLHARPAELFAKQALRYESEIEIIKDGYRVDAKSILHILTLGAEEGTELILEARGSDAEDALEVLVDLVRSNFAVNKDNST